MFCISAPSGDFGQQHGIQNQEVKTPSSLFVLTRVWRNDL